MVRHARTAIHDGSARLGRLAAVLALAIAMLAVVPAPARAVEGSVVAWGDNALGQIGDGTSTDRLTPAPTNAPADITSIHTGRGHVVALRADGTVVAWGSNDRGQIGDGTVTDRHSPVPVSGLTNVIAVSTGHYHSLALRSDGTVWGWGYNALGQLGDGTLTNRRAPVQVSGLTNVIAIAGGRDMSYALRSDGTVWAWGENGMGQLGDGTTTDRRTPVRVGTLTNVVDIAGGRDHGLALLSDGTVRAWGHNQYGQVGDNTLTNRTSPVTVSGLSGVADVIAGAHHSFALLANGTVRSWGRNQRGQLGDGTTTMRRVPVPVTGLANVVAIGSGRDHGLAILADGTGRAWGFNDLGQLGDGTTTNRRTPVVISGLAGAVEAYGGRDFSAALVTTSIEPDEDPPTTPGTPAGSSATDSSITISWAASSDASPITYRVFRDGGPVPVGTTSSTTFTDAGLAASSTHTYAVQAVDAFDNESALSGTSAPITVLDEPPPPTSIFEDDFSSGNLSSWTSVTRVTIDGSTGGVAPPSARAQVTGQTGFAWRSLGASYTSICAGLRVNLASKGSSTVPLLRLETATGTDVVRIFVGSTGALVVKSDVSGVQRSSNVNLGSGWHALELCGTVGTSGAWTLSRDGVTILNAWVANTGTTGIGRVLIGASSAATFTANYDDVVVDDPA